MQSIALSTFLRLPLAAALGVLVLSPRCPAAAARAAERPPVALADQTSGSVVAQEVSKNRIQKPAPTVLFVGNSFTFGYGSPVRFFRASSVTDLNGEGIGGVPALFRLFAQQAGQDFAVSLETAGGKNLDFHLTQKASLILRRWDHVVLQGQSMLDKEKPGDPTALVAAARELSGRLRGENPEVNILLMATWSRADLTYPEKKHWTGRPIEQMALDVRAGYDLAASQAPAVSGVVAVGEAWNRAMAKGVADKNPYDGIEADKLDLWTFDHFHASTAGYYLEALMVFGEVTGLDPACLGGKERAAFELGLSPKQATALQQVASEQLMAGGRRERLGSFAPVVAGR